HHDDHHDQHHHHDLPRRLLLRGRSPDQDRVHDRNRLRHLRAPRVRHERELLLTCLRRTLLRRRRRGRAAAVQGPRPGVVDLERHLQWHDAYGLGNHGDPGGREPVHSGCQLHARRLVHGQRRLRGDVHYGRRLLTEHLAALVRQRELQQREVRPREVHERRLPLRPTAADPQLLERRRGNQHVRDQHPQRERLGQRRLRGGERDEPEPAAQLRHLPDRRPHADAVFGRVERRCERYRYGRLRHHRRGYAVPRRQLCQRHGSLPQRQRTSRQHAVLYGLGWRPLR